MLELAKAVELSNNAKTGPVSATYAAQHSCPPYCPLRDAGCYAESGPTGIHTKALNRAKLDATAMEVAEAEAHVIRTRLSGTRDLRLHVVGDCPSNEAAQLVSEAALTTTRRQFVVWSYTHAWPDVDRAAWADVEILASCESVGQLDAARERGYATALVVPVHETDKAYRLGGHKLLPCPNQTRDVSCVQCRLCMNTERLRQQDITIAFAAHGARFKVVRRLLPTLNQ